MSAQRWKENQFRFLLEHPEMTDSQLVTHIDHPAGGVGATREAIHDWHAGTGNFANTGLSIGNRAILEHEGSRYRCPRCRRSITRL